MPITTDTGSSNAVSTVAGTAPGIGLDGAYAFCARLARTHYENFNVGGCITPRDKLPHVHAIYAWCRMVDDLGDESGTERAPTKTTYGHIDPSVSRHRLERLDWWQSELDLVYGGEPTHPVNVAVQHTVRRRAFF